MKNQINQTKRVALYARVSTLDKGQDPETQLTQLREYALRRNFEIIGEFIDYASGTTQDRVQYKLMMAVAKKRKLDVVLVWRYDRFARSTQALVNAMKEFQSMGIDFISYQENIDTTTPTGELNTWGKDSVFTTTTPHSARPRIPSTMASRPAGPAAGADPRGSPAGGLAPARVFRTS